VHFWSTNNLLLCCLIQALLILLSVQPFATKHGMKMVTLGKGGYNISVAENNISTNHLVLGAKIEIEGRLYDVDLVVLPGLGLDVILGMK
jgi:hypothetical protein